MIRFARERVQDWVDMRLLRTGEVGREFVRARLWVGEGVRYSPSKSDVSGHSLCC